MLIMNSMFKNFALLILLGFILPVFASAEDAGSAYPPQAIITASYRGDDSMVRELLAAGVDKDVRDALGATALHTAMLQSNLVVVKLLLDYGFDPNARATKNGNTPLHYAVACNNIGAVRLLLQYNANKNIRNLEGLTPLEKARKEEKEEIVKILYR